MGYMIQPKLIVEGRGRKEVIGFAGAPPRKVTEESGQWIGRGKQTDYGIPERMYTSIGIHRRDCRMTLRHEVGGTSMTLFRQQGSLEDTTCTVFVVTLEGTIRGGKRLDIPGEFISETLKEGEGVRILYGSAHKGRPRGVFVVVDLFPEGIKYSPDAEVFGFGRVREARNVDEEIALFGLLDAGVEREIQLASPEFEK